jgi:hypothetical protein
MIQGSVVVNGTAGANSVTLPQGGLILVGVSQSKQTAPNVMTLPIDSQNNAVFIVGTVNTPYTPVIPFQHPTTGQVVTFNLLNAQQVAIYYGIPDADAPSLYDFAGVYSSISIPASTTSISGSVNFPINSVLTGIYADTTNTFMTITIQTGLGYALNYLALGNGHGRVVGVGNLKIPTLLSFTGSCASLSSATVGLVVFYYEYGAS